MTGPVNPREIEEMSRLRRIMNGEIAEEIRSSGVSNAIDYQEHSGSIGQHLDAKDDMKAIMEIFQRGAKESVQRVTESAQESRPLRDALVTQKTTNGVQMGSWEIKVSEDRGTKSYDVTNIHTNDAIAQDLTLYESALCLCKLLNFHVGINSQAVREVLNLEEQYTRQRQEASLFKLRHRQRTASEDYTRAAIAEDRYQEAKTLALSLREQIVAKSKSL